VKSTEAEQFTST